MIDLLKRYTQVEDRDDTGMIRARVTGQVLPLDQALEETIPALLGLLEALPEDHALPIFEPPQWRPRTWRRSDVCSCAKARCSRCCWSSKTCTGSMLKPGPAPYAG